MDNPRKKYLNIGDIPELQDLWSRLGEEDIGLLTSGIGLKQPNRGVLLSNPHTVVESYLMENGTFALKNTADKSFRQVSHLELMTTLALRTVVQLRELIKKVLLEQADDCIFRHIFIAYRLTTIHAKVKHWNPPVEQADQPQEEK